jgi:hypothetical protein
MKNVTPCMETLLEVVMMKNSLPADKASENILNIKKELKGKKEHEISVLIQEKLGIGIIYLPDIKSYNISAHYNKILLPPKKEDLEKLTEQFLF